MASKSRSSRAPVARSSPTIRAGAVQSRGNAARTTVRPPGRGTPVASTGKARAAKGQNEVAAVEAAPVTPVWLQWLTFAFALLGIAASIYLTYTHFSESKLLGCSESGLVNCQKVTTSPQSYVFGIPVAVLGLAFYAFAVPIMSPWAWRAAPSSTSASGIRSAWQTFVRAIPVLRLVSVIVGVGFVLYLLYAELFIIGSICLYCTSVHIITFVLFLLTVLAAAAWGLRPARREAGEKAA
jgi:uncharacterized membrane protein